MKRNSGSTRAADLYGRITHGPCGFGVSMGYPHVYNFVCEYECFSFSKNTAVNYYVMSLSDRC